VALTPTHLAIVMEYAAGGEMFYKVLSGGRMREDQVCSLSLPHSHLHSYDKQKKKKKKRSFDFCHQF